MATRLQLRKAGTDDLTRVLSLIDDAAKWLRTKGTTQWNKPWPNREARDGRVHQSLALGETWLLWDGPAPIGTVTASPTADESLWTPKQCKEPAVYLHRLVVDRAHAGFALGSSMLAWVGGRAYRRKGARWVRIDVWTDNYALHRYYVGQGFVRVSGAPGIRDYPASALFQKEIVPEPWGQRFLFDVVDGSGDGARAHARPSARGDVPAASASP